MAEYRFIQLTEKEKQENMRAYERRLEAEKLAKMVNKRLRYAEKYNLIIMNQYKEVIELISMSGRGKTTSGRRFRENLGAVADKYIDEFLPLLRRASTFKDFSGEKAKERIHKTYMGFKNHFGDKVTDDDVSDFLEFQRSEYAKLLNELLPSDQVMEVVQVAKQKNTTLDSMIDNYISNNIGQEFNPRKFIEFVYKY